MEFSRKNFPYPVLAINSDDYKDSWFTTDVNFVLDGTKIAFKFEYDLNNNGLTRLVQEGKASVVFHMECPRTSYRKALRVHSNSEVHEIEETLLNGKLEVSTFIVAVENITNYSDDSLDEMLRAYSFDFEVGSILAVGNQFNFLINKEMEELVNVASIFKLVKNEQINVIEYDANKERIIIYLPEQAFASYSTLRETPALQTVLSGLVIVPVLSSILTEVASGKGSEYDDTLWFLSLEKQLNERFELSLSSEDLSSYGKSMLRLAQELINSPTTKGLDILRADYTGEKEKGDSNE